jgi:hypothetical protein
VHAARFVVLDLKKELDEHMERMDQKDGPSFECAHAITSIPFDKSRLVAKYR